MEEKGFSLKKALFGSIRKKFAVWIGLTIIFLLIVAISENSYISNIGATYEEIETDILPGTIAILEIKGNLEKLKAYTIGYIVRGNVERNGKTVKEWIDEAGLDLSNASKRHLEYESYFGPEEVDDAEELDRKVDQLVIVNNKIVEMKDRGAESGQLMDEMNKLYKPLYFPISNQVNRHLETHKTELEDKGKKFDRQITETKTILLSSTLFIIFLSSVIGFFISQSIVQPVKKLSNAIREIKKGNFKVRVNIKSGDELEEMGATVNMTVNALEKSEQEHKELDHAKTEFLSITSHELRSPMTPMKAQLQMLKEGFYGKLNKKQAESLDLVLRNTTRLDNIIVDFLDISRIEAARLKFRFVKADLTPHIQRLIKSMKEFMPEKKIKYVANIGRLPVIEVDPDRTMQILRNLVNNATKFSPENSTITISAQARKTDILFSVKDKGIGISKENQLRIFEPFFQEEQTMYRKFGGTGLGLTICKGIAESQKGKLWVESEKEKGSTFYFTVPFTPEKNIKPIKMLFSPQEDIRKKAKKVLINALGPLGEKEFNILQSKGHKNTLDTVTTQVRQIFGSNKEQEIDPSIKKSQKTGKKKYLNKEKEQLKQEAKK